MPSQQQKAHFAVLLTYVLYLTIQEVTQQCLKCTPYRSQHSKYFQIPSRLLEAPRQKPTRVSALLHVPTGAGMQNTKATQRKRIVLWLPFLH